ncbi:MAG: hypothetical protein PHX18_07220 [Candidatus Gastranaerophilales bacterium]|nr:hypothetical protein [Candidatus Gastranaerophilales bacterium]
MNTPQVQGIMPYEEEDPTPYHDWGSEAGKNFPSPFGILFKPRTTQNAYADESETIPEEPSPSENGKDDILKGRVEYEERRVPPPDYRDYPDEEEDEEDKKKKPKQLNLLELLATDGISLAKAIHTGSGINQVELFNDIKNNIGSSLKDYPEAQPLYTDVSDMRQAAYRQHVFEVNNMQEEAAIEKQKLDEMAAKFYENYGNAEIPMSMEPMSTPDYYRTPPAPIKNNEAEEFYQARKEAPEPDYNYNYNPYTRYVYGYDDSLRQNYNKAFESQRPQNSGYRPPAEPVFYPQTPYDPSQEPGFDFENYAKQQQVDEINAYHEALRQQYEQELQRELAKIWAGGALEIASAGVPVGGAMKIGSKVLAPALTPALGRFLANRIAEGTAAGTVGGAVEDAGRSIRGGENVPDIAKNIALGALGGAAIGGATGGLFGAGKRAWDGNELKNYADVKKLSTPERKELRKFGKKYYQNYVQQTSVNRKDLGEVKFYGDGLRETINQQPNNVKNFSDLRENIKKAKYVGEEVLNHPRRDGIIKFHRLRYKGEDYLVGETQSGDKIYHISKKSPND